ncbi:hypothetical protein XaCFBP7622_14735 [Xanthomonas arboricola]|nr:hypothetical protein XaCFBP7622_14735 [Xanthomonas arboricola]
MDAAIAPPHAAHAGARSTQARHVRSYVPARVPAAKRAPRAALRWQVAVSVARAGRQWFCSSGFEEWF